MQRVVWPLYPKYTGAFYHPSLCHTHTITVLFHWQNNRKRPKKMPFNHFRRVSKQMKMIYISRDDFSFRIISKGVVVHYNLKENKWFFVYSPHLVDRLGQQQQQQSYLWNGWKSHLLLVHRILAQFSLTIKSSFTNEFNAHNGFCCAVYDE